MIVDSGKCPWKEHTDKLPMLNQPDPSYHDVSSYTQNFGHAAYIARCRIIPQRNMGATLLPFNTFLLLQGLEILSLRIERHGQNTIKVANYLASHPQVEWGNYAALANHPEHYLTIKQMDNGLPAGLLSFWYQRR